MDELFRRARRRHPRREPAKNVTHASLNSGDLRLPLRSAQVEGESKKLTPRDLWTEALQNLSVSDQAILQPPNPAREASAGYISSSPATIEDLLVLTHKKRDQCDERRWKFKINGKDVILRDVAEKVAGWLLKLNFIGDITSNIDPIHVGPAIIGVRLLLQAVTANSEQMAALLIGSEIVIYLVNRCKIYEILYVQDCDQSQVQENLCAALVSLYTGILQFLARANRHYDRNAMSKTVSAILNLDETQSFAQSCHNLESRVEADANNCERMYVRQSNKEERERLFVLERALSALEVPTLRTDQRMSQIWKHLDQSRQTTILQWISDIPYEGIHKSSKSKRTPSTGNWLLDHDSFLQWRESSASMFLWLHGIPGAGKTILVGSVVDHLLHELRQQSNDEAFAYFYCNRDSKTRRDFVSILRSFVRQLSIDRTASAIQPAITQLYDLKELGGFSSGNLDVGECIDLLTTYCELYPQTTFVLDALDECDENTQAELIDFCDHLVNVSPKVVKIFIASRLNEIIKHRFERGPNIGMRAEDNYEDISTFVTASLEQDSKRRRIALPTETKSLIKETLLKQSQGMFQWAALQIKQLLEMKRAQDMLLRLGKLPSTLQKAYDEIYDQIENQPGSGSVIAKRVFSWMIAAVETISPDALVDLAFQDPSKDIVFPVDIDIEFVLHACGNLLSVDTEFDVCQFTHLSVKEYLENRGYGKTDCHDLASRICLKMLTADILHFDDIEYHLFLSSTSSNVRIESLQCWSELHELRDSTSLTTNESEDQRCEHSSEYQNILQDFDRYNNVLQKCLSRSQSDPNETQSQLDRFFFGAFAYSLLCWFEHVQRSEATGEHPELSRLLILFLGSFNESSIHYRKWYILFTMKSLNWNMDDEKHNLGSTLAPFNASSPLVCALGLYNLLKIEWCRNDINIEQRDGLGDTLLITAAKSGNLQICSRLLELGIQVDSRGRMRGPHSTGTTALFETVHNDERLAITKVFLDHGADPDAAGIKTGEALLVAACRGGEKTCQLLIERGSSMIVVTGSVDGTHKYGTALNAAAANGHTNIVRLLLHNTKNLNTSKGLLEAPSPAAPAEGHMGVIRTPIPRGVYIDAVGESHKTALMEASENGHLDIVQLLLDSGADHSKVDNEDNTALVLATLRGHVNIAQLLLASGATFNAPGTSLADIVSDTGDKNIIPTLEVLIAHGADINGIDPVRGTALTEAMRSNNLDIARFLLSKGASTTIAGGGFGTALHAAAFRANRDAILLLLSHGANINQVAGYCGTVLQEAVRVGHLDTVKLLVAHGADVNLQAGQYGTACRAARSRGHFDIYQFLRGEGAVDVFDPAVDLGFEKDLDWLGDRPSSEVAVDRYWKRQRMQ